MLVYDCDDDDEASTSKLGWLRTTCCSVACSPPSPPTRWSKRRIAGSGPYRDRHGRTRALLSLDPVPLRLIT